MSDMTSAQRAMVEGLKGKLIVGSQAYPGEPMRHPETMAQIALSAQIGGAAAIRCQGLSDIAAIKGMVSVPVIGIWKEGEEGVYITPTVRHARCCMAAGADIVALDATSRPRPDGRDLAETVRILKSEGALLMADCGSSATPRTQWRQDSTSFPPLFRATPVNEKRPPAPISSFSARW